MGVLLPPLWAVASKQNGCEARPTERARVGRRPPRCANRARGAGRRVVCAWHHRHRFAEAAEGGTCSFAQGAEEADGRRRADAVDIDNVIAKRRDGTLDLEQGVERRGPAKRERFRERYDLRVIILFICVCVCVSCV